VIDRSLLCVDNDDDEVVIARMDDNDNAAVAVDVAAAVVTVEVEVRTCGYGSVILIGRTTDEVDVTVVARMKGRDHMI
jgi:hypothetical protein